MKELNTYFQDTTAVQDTLCSEKKCINCFENRGCIYDHYVHADTNNNSESYPFQQQQSERGRGSFPGD